jgi:hypothetical protein
VGTYFDEQTLLFAPQHPTDYRLPDGMPPREQLTGYVQRYYTKDADRVDRKAKELCCGPPIVEYQGDMILAALEEEGVGTRDVTDLVYINFKSPDYAGHTWNYLNFREGIVLRAVDRQIGRIRRFLEQRFQPGEYVLVVTADHGQSPLPDLTGGARVDPIQLKRSLEREFGPGFLDLIQDVKPSEVYVHTERLWQYGVSLDDLAAFLRDYRYRDNIGSYVDDEAIDQRRLDDRLFAAVLPNTYIGNLGESEVAAVGAGVYDEEDPGIPPVTWR